VLHGDLADQTGVDRLVEIRMGVEQDVEAVLRRLVDVAQGVEERRRSG
jgi:hypothetical protein